MRARASKRRLAAAVLLASVPAAGALSSCGGTPSVSVELDDPDAVRDRASFALVLVYDGGCPSLEALSRGELGSPARTLEVNADEDLGRIGELATKKYGFAAILRDADCAVLASGCTQADLSEVTTIVVPVGAVSPPSGACPGACANGECPGGEGGGGGGSGGGGSGGAMGGCTLERVADGALPPLAIDGASVTGPGVAATADGFVIAYREGVSGQPVRATLLRVDHDGKPSTPATADVPSCIEPDDGVAVAASDTGGVVAMTRMPCPGTGAGLSLVPFTGAGTPGAPTATADFGPTLRLARSHGLTPLGASYEAAFVAGSSAYRARVDDDGFASPEALFPSETSTFAAVASTPGLVAFLADRTGGSEPDTTLLWMPASALADGGAGGGASTSKIAAASLGRATWGAVTAWDAFPVDRTAALVGGPSGLTWAAFDANGAARGAGALAPKAGEVLTSSDLVASGAYIVAAAARAHGYRLSRLDGAFAERITASGLEVDETGVAGAQSLGSYDGARIALAAGGGRVLVAWIARDKPSAGDPAGGFAVYACGL